MKHVLLSVCLTMAAITAPTTLTRLSNLDGAVAMRSAISYTCIRSEIVVFSSDQREVHAVVVDMPQRASLEHASPETWATLPAFDPPYEQPPATTVLQVAMN
jgi:hypothetical protein